ncbi:MAG: vWA domain-containing protein [Acidimicrobiia bacterium]
MQWNKLDYAMRDRPLGTSGERVSAISSEPAMLDVLQGFVHELRLAGLPVSMTENLDAMRAVEYVPLQDRDAFKTALCATLVKHHGHHKVFDTVFEVYFSIFSPGVEGGEAGELGADAQADFDQLRAEMDAGGAMGQLSNEELAQMLLQALMRMDTEQLRALAGAAVARFAGMEPGRPVGGAYYLYRTLRQLDAEGLVAKMMEQAEQDQQIGAGSFDERLAREEYEGRLKVLKEMIEAEIRRRLVADRGVEAMARTLRKPLPEDVDFMHASREEMQQLQKAIYPLTRALAARLAQRRRHRHRGTLDFRRTVRQSLSYGGVPAEPRFKRPRPSKPEIMVVADISGSVASFARFTLQFVYAMQSEFSKVRSWVFIDGVDEVTRFFDESDELATAINRVNTEADVVWVDGHSDYGHAFEVWHERHIREVTRKSSIILLGDARNNYHAAQAWTLAEMRKRARRLFWLDPEPRGYWDTGDSIISEYAPYCDGVYEVRNLRQLHKFVEDVVSV